MEDIRENVGTDSGATPLLVACQNGHVEVVDLLLRREDVDVNRSTTCKMTAANNGVTPLFAAATHGHDRVVEMLLDRGDIQANGLLYPDSKTVMLKQPQNLPLRLLQDRPLNMSVNKKANCLSHHRDFLIHWHCKRSVKYLFCRS